MTNPTRPEEVDIEFMSYFHKRQPFEQILRSAKYLSTEQVMAVREEIQQAFVHGYARGVAAEAARPNPDDDGPSPGLTA
jgi:hypothetical protein